MKRTDIGIGQKTKITIKLAGPKYLSLDSFLLCYSSGSHIQANVATERKVGGIWPMLKYDRLRGGTVKGSMNVAIKST